MSVPWATRSLTALAPACNDTAKDSIRQLRRSSDQLPGLGRWLYAEITASTVSDDSHSISVLGLDSLMPGRLARTLTAASCSPIMHSLSGMLDSLMHEIGGLRNDARGLDSRVLDEQIVSDIDRHIANAAQAIEDSIGVPEDEDGLIGACEAIVVARDRIEAVRAAVKRSRTIVEHSASLRKEAARQLYDALRARNRTKPS
jgi:hypothetical protein